MKWSGPINRIMIVVTIFVSALANIGCSDLHDVPFGIMSGSYGNNQGSRVTAESDRDVLLLYSAGYNSLWDYLRDDINDLKKGWLPGNSSKDNVLLVYSHLLTRNNSYDRPVESHLVRLYAKSTGEVVCDTLQTYPSTVVSASPQQFNEVLTYIKDNIPAASYGMIFSSHATGYLPSGFYSSPNSYIFNEATLMEAGRGNAPKPVPYVEPEFDPSLPMVKSIGQQQVGTIGNYYSYEIDIKSFADAIPMKLDYLLFDACLMGGIEVAYELRDKVRKIGASQAEVLAEGLDYKTLTNHLLKGDTPDPLKVCEDYFTQYDIQSGVYRSATISFIDCEKLDNLASTCSLLFDRHREGIESLTSNEVQRFYRSNKQWFFDLESIVTLAGASSEEISDLHEALDECIIYKAHTPEFMCEFSIKTFSGFSMFLPRYGTRELRKYYKTLKWNEATGLVE